MRGWHILRADVAGLSTSRRVAAVDLVLRLGLRIANTSLGLHVMRLLGAHIGVVDRRAASSIAIGVGSDELVSAGVLLAAAEVHSNDAANQNTNARDSDSNLRVQAR